jgi:seryl-tRNA synthetase
MTLSCSSTVKQIKASSSYKKLILDGKGSLRKAELCLALKLPPGEKVVRRRAKSPRRKLTPPRKVKSKRARKAGVGKVDLTPDQLKKRIRDLNEELERLDAKNNALEKKINENLDIVVDIPEEVPKPKGRFASIFSRKPTKKEEEEKKRKEEEKKQAKNIYSDYQKGIKEAGEKRLLKFNYQKELDNLNREIIMELQGKKKSPYLVFD